MSISGNGVDQDGALRSYDGGLTRLGRYRFLLEIGRGGMAEVFLSVMEGPAQFNKLIAVKVLRSHVSEQADGREMFLNEARLAARLNHPNVVSVHEVGDDNGHLFIAMEYLKGQPFSKVLTRLRETQQTDFTLEMRLHILCEALSGLQHAHQCADFDGTPLDLVHRDVTPHNIFVTYDGSVKVLDFGIAKSVSSSAVTQTGVVKGKVGFMAPEQLTGDGPLDCRADIYAVGCCLWETIAGRRPYKGLADAALLTKVVTVGVPPIRTAVPDIDPELERICNKAVAYDRTERYGNAADFRADLDAYITKHCGRIQAHELGVQLSQLFKADREQAQRMIKERIAQVRLSGSAELPAGLNVTGMGSGSWSSPSQTGQSFTPSSIKSDSSMHSVPASGAPSLPAPSSTSRGRLAAAVLVGLALFTVLVVLLTRAAGPSPAAQAAAGSTAPAVSVKIKLSAFPAAARLMLDGAVVAMNPMEMTFKKDGTRHWLRAEAVGFETKSVEFALDDDKELHIALDPVAVPDKPAVSADKAEPSRHMSAGGAAAPTKGVGTDKKSAGRPDTAAPTAAPAKAGPDCSNPYYVNSAGIKSIRSECL